MKQLAAWCSQGRRPYSSLHKRPGQRLMIVKDGERNGPLLTMRSDDDHDDSISASASLV